MDVSLHVSKDLSTLRHLVAKESNAKQRDRYRAVLLALGGASRRFAVAKQNAKHC